MSKPETLTTIKLRPAVAEDFYRMESETDKLVKYYNYGMFFWLRSQDGGFQPYVFKRGAEAAKAFARYFKAGFVYVPDCSAEVKK